MFEPMTVVRSRSRRQDSFQRCEHCLDCLVTVGMDSELEARVVLGLHPLDDRILVKDQKALIVARAVAGPLQLGGKTLDRAIADQLEGSHGKTGGPSLSKVRQMLEERLIGKTTGHVAEIR